MGMAAALNSSIPELRGRVLVIGLGLTGRACVRYLRRTGVNVAAADTRDHPPAVETLRQDYPDLPLFLGGAAQQAFRSADLILLSPGIALSDPVVQAAHCHDIPVWGDIELFARLADAPIAAITGSNGKSSVTTLVGQMAERAGRQVRVGGNLGTPALDLLDQQADLYVLELSSFQLETTYSLSTQVAAVLNLSADHLDRYPSLAAYRDAKARIFDGAGVQVVNRDDPQVCAMIRPGRRVLGFSLGNPKPDEYGLMERADEVWLCRGPEPLLRASELVVPGRHNLANALAALAVGEALGFGMADMLASVCGFTGLPHRCQLVRERRGVSFFDDSKGTNVGATVAAIQGLPGTIVLIAGGQGKGQDFSPLRSPVETRARSVILIGEDASHIADALGSGVPVLTATSMDQAVAMATDVAQAGDSVLLSPACASFDMYRNYMERGRAFAAAVARLAP
jgi:UDP-N-acetylmuramoylalanine--D-glutamate ligase